MHGAPQRPLLELVRLADVEGDRPVATSTCRPPRPERPRLHARGRCSRSRNVGIATETLPAWSAFRSRLVCTALELDAAVARRRMCRSFLERPVERDVLERALALATRAPSAGNTQGWAFLVLEGDETAKFWQQEADSSWLAHPSHPGLLKAPVIVLPLASRASYLERYSEPDKAPPGAAPGRGMGGAVLVGRHCLRHHAAAARRHPGRAGRPVLRPAQAGRARSWPTLGVPPEWEPLGAVATGLAEPGRQTVPVGLPPPQGPWPRSCTGGVGEGNERPGRPDGYGFSKGRRPSWWPGRLR